MATARPICIRVPTDLEAEVETLRADLEAERLADGAIGQPRTKSDVMLAAMRIGVGELRKRRGK